MAKVEFSSPVRKISGKTGNLVFRQVAGKNIISRRPPAREAAPSAAQVDQRDRFRQATAYAKSVLADPWQRRVYERMAASLERRADKLVTADFLNPPIVEEIDATEYRGQPGGRIRVLAHDDVEVVSVELALTTAAGTVVEQGSAVKTHGVWMYRATAPAPAGEPLTVTATARDRPGHSGMASVVLPR